MVQFRMTTSVIKQVHKLAGGIDQYILTTRNEELLYPKVIQMKRNMRRIIRTKLRDEAIAKQLGSGVEGAVAQEGAVEFEVPKLWAHKQGEHLGFPWKFGKYWNAEHQRLKPFYGHASRR